MLRTGNQRWLSFSLRTLFVLLTIAAIGIGFIAERARRQRIAVAALRKVFAEIQYGSDTDIRQLSEQSARDSRIDFLHSVVAVMLDAPAVNDDALVHLKAFPHLKSLSIIEGCQVTGVGMRHLRELPRLERLMISSVKMDDHGLELIAEQTQLVELWIDEAQITDEGRQKLAGLKNLRELVLDAKQLTPAGIERLQTRLPECQIVH